MTLRFRALQVGATTLKLEGSLPNDPAALDSGLTVIPSVQFDSAPATISAN